MPSQFVARQLLAHMIDNSSPASDVNRRWGLRGVPELECSQHICEAVNVALATLFATPGLPAQLFSNNGPLYFADAILQWLAQVVVQTRYIEAGRESDSTPACSMDITSLVEF
jgi:hypothetical protein